MPNRMANSKIAFGQNKNWQFVRSPHGEFVFALDRMVASSSYVAELTNPFNLL